MFASKAKSGTPERRLNLGQAPGLTRKHSTRLESLARANTLAY